jgi:hypothetical protein
MARIGVKSTESDTRRQGAPTLGFFTNFPIVCGPLDRRFTDQAAVQIKTAVAPALAESFAMVAHRRRQLHPALWVPAIGAGRCLELGHASTKN